MARQSTQIELMLKQGKSNARILMNTALILVAFAIFALLFAIPSSDLIHNSFLTMQMVLAVPFLLMATMAESKLSYTKHEKHWDNLGWAMFIFGYGFLLNSIGIFVFNLIGMTLSMVFFAINIGLMLLYSIVEVSYNKYSAPRRFVKDLIFILILVLGGIIPILGM